MDDDGMTPRDWFAGMALSGLMAYEGSLPVEEGKTHSMRGQSAHISTQTRC